MNSGTMGFGEMRIRIDHVQDRRSVQRQYHISANDNTTSPLTGEPNRSNRSVSAPDPSVPNLTGFSFHIVLLIWLIFGTREQTAERRWGSKHRFGPPKDSGTTGLPVSSIRRGVLPIITEKSGTTRKKPVLNFGLFRGTEGISRFSCPSDTAERRGSLMAFLCQNSHGYAPMRRYYRPERRPLENQRNQI